MQRLYGSLVLSFVPTVLRCYLYEILETCMLCSQPSLEDKQITSAARMGIHLLEDPREAYSDLLPQYSSVLETHLSNTLCCRYIESPYLDLSPKPGPAGSCPSRSFYRVYKYFRDPKQYVSNIQFTRSEIWQPSGALTS